MRLDLHKTHRGFATALLLSAAVGIVGCATVNGIPTTTLTPAAQADLQAAANSFCPVLSAIEQQTTLNPSLATTDVTAAEKVLAEACPPNPLPTNGAVVAVDLINAYVIVEPLLPKATAAKARARYATMKAKYGLK
jgi:hypothetical protein